MSPTYLLIAKFEFLPNNPSNIDDIQFIDTSNQSLIKIISWHWDFGEGNESNEPNPMHKYSHGKYTITLTVTDEFGMQDKYYQKIDVSNWTPPKIFHTPILNRIEGKSIDIISIITSGQKIKNAFVFYRKTGTKEYTKISMEQKGEHYIATIPAKDVTTDGIQYYILATDGINNGTSPEDNPDTIPYKITFYHPDLKISQEDITFSSKNPKEGNTITISVYISNIGTLNATNITISLFEGENFIESKIIKKLDVNRAITIYFNFTGKGGINKIRIVIDPENEIFELNETNNEAYKEINFQKKDFPILIIVTIIILVVIIGIFSVVLYKRKISKFKTS